MCRRIIKFNMTKKYSIIFGLIVFGCIAACIPTFLNIRLWQYIVGIVGYVIILLATALFVIKISERGEDTETEDNNKITRTLQRVNKVINTIFDAFNNVGCALLLCISLIIGIGIFDALMSNHFGNKKDSPVPCSSKCNCIILDTLRTMQDGKMK